MKRYIPLVIMLAVFISSGTFAQHSGPASQFTCIGETAVFKVEHSTDFETFEWQASAGPSAAGFTPITASTAYSGISTDRLEAYTAVINPSSGGVYKYYRCRMVSVIHGEQFSDTAFLEINIPPSVDFTWRNPCEGQTVQFESEVSNGEGPFKYLWSFGDSAESVSVYPDPSHLYAKADTYEVTLKVTDVNGCEKMITKPVKIYGIPVFTISGKEVVCSNELGVGYNVDYEGELDGDTVMYSWDISGFGNINDNTLGDVLINWNAVTEPTQTKIMITATIEPSGCVTSVSSDVLITSYVAPPPAEEVFRKPYESALLIYKGPEVNSYRWGYTDDKGNDSVKEGENRFYCDFGNIDADFEYWVETSYDSRINCVTRSFLPEKYKNMPDLADSEFLFTVYPVPASDQLTVRFDNIANPSGIIIYNLMMQKVYENRSLTDTKGEFRLGLEHFISGVYLIQVTDDSGFSNFRVFTIEK